MVHTVACRRERFGPVDCFLKIFQVFCLNVKVWVSCPDKHIVDTVEHSFRIVPKVRRTEKFSVFLLLVSGRSGRKGSAGMLNSKVLTAALKKSEVRIPQRCI